MFQILNSKTHLPQWFALKDLWFCTQRMVNMSTMVCFCFWASGVGFMVGLMAKMLGRQVPLNSLSTLFSSLWTFLLHSPISFCQNLLAGKASAVDRWQWCPVASGWTLPSYSWSRVGRRQKVTSPSAKLEAGFLPSVQHHVYLGGPMFINGFKILGLVSQFLLCFSDGAGVPPKVQLIGMWSCLSACIWLVLGLGQSSDPLPWATYHDVTATYPADITYYCQ